MEFRILPSRTDQPYFRPAELNNVHNACSHIYLSKTLDIIWKMFTHTHYPTKNFSPTHGLSMTWSSMFQNIGRGWELFFKKSCNFEITQPSGKIWHIFWGMFTHSHYPTKNFIGTHGSSMKWSSMIQNIGRGWKLFFNRSCNFEISQPLGKIWHIFWGMFTLSHYRTRKCNPGPWTWSSISQNIVHRWWSNHKFNPHTWPWSSMTENICQRSSGTWNLIFGQEHVRKSPILWHILGNTIFAHAVCY